MNGFVAGTLVHTDKGLTPIQELKVGDLVLTMNQNINEKQYQPIVNTLKSSEKQSIYKVEYRNSSLSDETPENCDNYLFCTDSQPFWVIGQNPSFKSDWLVAHQLFSARIFEFIEQYVNEDYQDDITLPKFVSAIDDNIWLTDCAFLPVRTLPNFPQGGAYTNHLAMFSVYHNVEWHETGGIKEFLNDEWKNDRTIEFISFSQNDYSFISLGDENSLHWALVGGDPYQLIYPTSDAFFHVTKKAPFKIDVELYKLLNTRLYQDANRYCGNLNKLIEWYNSPLYIEGHMFNGTYIEAQMVSENKLDSDKAKRQYEYALNNLQEYGDETGLKEKSIHLQMKKFDDPCPNPYQDFVYNLEIAENKNYFVGYEGILTHDFTQLK